MSGAVTGNLTLLPGTCFRKLWEIMGVLEWIVALGMLSKIRVRCGALGKPCSVPSALGELRRDSAMETISVTPAGTCQKITPFPGLLD